MRECLLFHSTTSPGKLTFHALLNSRKRCYEKIPSMFFFSLVVLLPLYREVLYHLEMLLGNLLNLTICYLDNLVLTAASEVPQLLKESIEAPKSNYWSTNY